MPKIVEFAKVREEDMKRLAGIIMFLAMVMASVSASAEGTEMYLAPKFLMSIQNTGTVSRSSSLAGTGVDEYNQFTLGGAFALGLDLWQQQMIPLRFEVEVALRGNSEKSWSDNAYWVDSIKGTWNNTTIFANLFWDFHNESPFTPYIGGGLGLALNYTGYDCQLPNGSTYSFDDRQTNFAWNAGAGVAYNINENFALDASYRFVGLGYNEVSTTINGTKYEIGNEPYNNEFMLGLRFTF